MSRDGVDVRVCETCGGFQSIHGEVEGVSMGLRCPGCDGTGWELSPAQIEDRDHHARGVY